jgi:bla regulator protein blaR1
MIQYCINITLCSGLLFFLYKVLLENEKMHVFKRFYLLFSLVLSLIAPLITISFYIPAENTVIEYISREPVDLVASHPLSSASEESNILVFVVVLAYMAGAALGLFRFMSNIYYFFAVRGKAETVPFNEAKLVLVEKGIIPHSFLSNIYLNKKAYLDGHIENEILTHELAHVKQFHSIDVLLAQLIQCIFWFNPIFCFYTKAIQLNHEFLADESVIRSNTNQLLYQQLLLSKASDKERFSLASPFNYQIIKKRLVMIAKNTSPKVVVFKQLVLIPLFILTLFLFVQKETVAQKVEAGQTKKEVPSSASGASAELMNEYKTIVDRHESKNPKGYPEYSAFSEAEKDRLFTIFQMMTKEQQNKQNIIFRPNVQYPGKTTPTQAQLKAWLNPKIYGVWIGDKRIKNDELKNYKPSDFSYVAVSPLTKTAINYGKHYYQVNLMTNSEFAQKTKGWEAEPAFMLSIRNGLLHHGGKGYTLSRSPK